MNPASELRLADIMSAAVRAVAPGCSLREAAGLMAAEHISCLVVTEDRRPVGILTEHDVMRALHRSLTPESQVAAVMSAPVLTVPAGAGFGTAYQIMIDHHIRHLVVVDADQRVVGVVSETDIRVHLGLDTFRKVRNLASMMDREIPLLPGNVMLGEALARMVNDRRDYIIVGDEDGAPLGIVTERDMPRLLAEYGDPSSVPLRIAMRGQLETIDVAASAAEALDLMARRRYRHMPVTDGQRIVGVITQHRLLQHLGISALGDDLATQQAIARSLAEQQARLTTLVETIPDLVWLKDPDGVYLLANGVTEDIMGVPRGSMVGKTDRDFFAPAIAEFLRSKDIEAVAMGMPTTVEEHVQMPNGQTYWLQTTKTPMRAADGQLIGVLGIARDVTASHENQAVLSKRMREMRCLYNIFRETERQNVTLPEMMARVAELLPSGCHSPDDAAARIVFDGTVRHSGNFQPTPRMLEVQFAVQDREGCIAIAYHDDHPAADVVLADERELLDAVAARLTSAIQRHSALERLRQSEERYSSVVAALGEGVIVVGADGCVQTANRAVSGIFGLNDPAVLIGNAVDNAAWTVIRRDLSVMPSHEYPILAALSSGREQRNVELGIKRPDGRLVWLSVNASPLFGADGKTVVAAVASFADITERVLAERRLQESEAALNEAQAIARVGSWTLYIPTNNLRWSPETYRIFGMPVGAHVTPRDLDARLHPDDRSIVEAAWNTALSTKDAHYAVDHRIVVNGVCYWVRERAQLRRNADGEAYFAIGTVQDITETREAQEQLRRSEARARAVIESSPVPMAINDEHGSMVYVNPAFVDTFGYTLADIPTLAEWWQQAYPDIHYRRAVTAEWQARADRMIVGNHRFDPQEVDIVCKDGDVRRMLLSAAPLDQTDDALLLVIFYDITERRAVETQLRKLSLAVEQSPNSIAITDIRGCIEYVNDAFVAASGYPRDELLGRNPRILQSGSTPRERYLALWETLLRGEAWQGEFVNRRKDGVEYIEFARISPIRQPDGTVTHYLAIKEDITERKRIGAELDRHRHHLEEMVAESTAELALAKQAAEQASQAKSAFLANISHEIRTPMNAVIGLAHIARRHSEDQAQRERLEKVEDAARHLLAIINDVLDISKIEAGKLVLETTDFSLERVVARALTMVEQRAAEKGLALRVDIAAELGGTLRGDPLRLGQILLNFLSNAVKFTPTGTITVAAQCLEENADDLTIRLAVADTGIGISPEDRRRLFDAFEQADSSTTRRFGGTGLGLAICRHLAQAMNGDIGVDSRIGYGSTFWCTVRLARGSAVSVGHEIVANAEAQLAATRRGTRILLAEDNAVNQEVALELLRDAGLSVDIAENGAKALMRVMAEDYALILMDVQMPIMDGIEATQAIRRLPGRATLPIIAMSANVFDDDRQRCRDAGMNAHLGKPVDPEALFSCLLRWLPEGTATSSPGGSLPAAAAPPLPAPANTQADLRQQLAAIAGLDVEAGIACVRGRMPSYVRLLAKYVETHANDTAHIRTALAVGPNEEARRLAHSLKGASGTLGAMEVQAAAAELETAIKTGRPAAELPPLLDALDRRLQPLMTALDKVVSATPN